MRKTFRKTLKLLKKHQCELSLNSTPIIPQMVVNLLGQTEDKKKLIEVRRNQLSSMSEMVDSLREDNEKLKKDNAILNKITSKPTDIKIRFPNYCELRSVVDKKYITNSNKIELKKIDNVKGWVDYITKELTLTNFTGISEHCYF